MTTARALGDTVIQAVFLITTLGYKSHPLGLRKLKVRGDVVMSFVVRIVSIGRSLVVVLINMRVA